MPKIILASGSPRRRELLAALGVSFECVVSLVHEDYEAYRGIRSEAVALAMATKKMLAVAGSREQDLVIASDTIVVLGEGEKEQVLGIPKNRRESKSMISMLSGRKHRVVTTVVMKLGTKEFSETDVTMVQFRRLSDVEIENYVASGEGDDKAGAYAVQGMGKELIDRMEGDVQTVIGFPLRIVRRGLSQFGIPVPHGEERQ